MNLGRQVVLKTSLSQELHVADVCKAGASSLFAVFGEPDIALEQSQDGRDVVRLCGMDTFDPTTGEVRSSAKVEDDVAWWFMDTDNAGDSFFVRHAYFLGGKDPFEPLKADIDPNAWASLYAAVSRPFARPASVRVPVKVIDYYGDEAMRVFTL